MYTGKEIFEMAMAVMDEISENGQLSPDDVAEYRAKAPYLLELWSKRMAKSFGNKKTFEFVATKKKNLLGDLNQVSNIVENNGEIQEYSGKGANCFYLEVDGDCRITFKEDGGSISGKYVFNNGEETDFTDTIEITVPEGTKTFLPVKGILFTQRQDSTITMTITGDYYFRHNNRALSPYKYPSVSKVPAFEAYYKIELPEDFISRTQIISEEPKWQYNEGSPQIKWENDRDLYVMFSYDGVIRINYVSLPKKITSLDQEIEYPEHIAISAVPYLVKHFARADMNDEIANDALQEFAQMYANTYAQEPLTPTQIIDVFNIGGDW